jgi:hypothetical protein
MKTRKVSTLVPTSQHKQLTQLAKKQQTTVGALVAFGTRLAVLFVSEGGALPALAPDHRRKGE